MTKLWHRNCVTCDAPFEQERHVGRPQETCGEPICVWVQRYRRSYGRWPARVWFERWAVAQGLVKVKLPKKVARLAQLALHMPEEAA